MSHNSHEKIGSNLLSTTIILILSAVLPTIPFILGCIDPTVLEQNNYFQLATICLSGMLAIALFVGHALLELSASAPTRMQRLVMHGYLANIRLVSLVGIVAAIINIVAALFIILTSIFLMWMLALQVSMTCVILVSILYASYDMSCMLKSVKRFAINLVDTR